MAAANPVRTDEEQNNTVSISDSYLTRMLWRFIKPYWWQLLAVFGLLISVSALDLSLPYLIQQTVDGPIADGNIEGVLPFGIVYLIIVFSLFALRFAYTYWLQTIGQNALVGLRQELFEHITRQDMKYFSVTPVGKIVSRMSNDIESLTELLSTSIVMVASSSITLIGLIGVMFALNWRLALISLAVIPVMAIVSLYFRVKIRAIATRFHRIMADYQAFLNEQFNGMLVVQLFGRQRKTLDDFEKINRDYFDAHMDIRDTYTYFASFLQIMTTVGLAMVLYGGGQGVLAEWASIGMLIAFIEYTRRSFEPILQLSDQFAQIQNAFSAGERIARMLLVEPDVKDPEKPQAVDTFEQSIELDHVNFTYKAGNPMIIDDVSLKINPGERIAIVGATGAGKTTLVKLLARYYDVDEGAVRISGIDIRELATPDLRRMISVVPQNPYCFNGTIADNLRLFDPSVTYEQMKEAARVACADRFIEQLPDGYDYMLLPGGGNLSHGQRQLLALARALIHSPNSILVLDEATSNIDTETEIFIQEGLERILAGRTSITIAHRLSTVRDADRILVMKQGKIIEDGSHDELLEVDGVYAQLYRRQFMEQAIDTGEPLAGD